MSIIKVNTNSIITFGSTTNHENVGYTLRSCGLIFLNPPKKHITKIANLVWNIFIVAKYKTRAIRNNMALLFLQKWQCLWI